MTINSTTRKSGPYTGNGVTTAFPFDFKVFETSDVLATFTDANGADTALVLNSDYTVVLNANQDNNPGGTITYPRVGSGLPNLDAGQKLTLTGSLPLTQPTDIPDLSAFFPHVVEDALDRSEIQIQQIAEQVDRSIKIGVSDTPLTPLPGPDARANQLIGFDALGNLITYPITSSVGAGDRIPFTLVAGVDFNPGVDTQVLLPVAPGAAGNLEVFFDPLFQGFDQWSLNGTLLTFTSAIPVGVSKIFGYIGTTLSMSIPPDGSITDAKIAPNSLLSIRMNELPFITDGGLVIGDGAANDSPGMLQRFNDEAGRQIIFPPGNYRLNTDVNAPAGSRAHFQTGVTFSGAGVLKNVFVEYETGRATAVAGNKMKIDRLNELIGNAYPAENLGYLWPVVTHCGYANSKLFGPADGALGAASMTSLNYGVSDGSPADVCGGLDIVALTPNNTGGQSVFGRNIIATNYPASLNSKLVGMEIDIQPSVGSGMSTQSAGLLINSFNTLPGPAIQLGGPFGGSFNNGIVINGMSNAAAAFSMQTGSSAAYGIHLANGGFSQSAIQLGAAQGLGWNVGSFINSDAPGNITLHSTAVTYVTGNSNAQGDTIFVARDISSIAAIQTFVSQGAPGNAAACALKVNTNSGTGRSINAGGTINASGADYAEYEVKREDCPALLKGSIVGFDADGKVTDRYSQAISFAVKSTSPNIVGGDTWALEAGDAPIAPVLPNPPMSEPPAPTNSIQYQRFKDQCDAYHAKEVAAWRKSVAEYDAKMVVYNAELLAHQQAYAAWQAKHESLRQKVDRIAYCGKVPVNVLGAQPGEYIVPVAGPDDSIVGINVGAGAVSFDQYRQAVGQVRRILEDGRAEITVKPI